MPHRKFATPKALIDYAEEKGLVYVWENGRRVARGLRLRPPSLNVSNYSRPMNTS